MGILSGEKQVAGVYFSLQDINWYQDSDGWTYLPVIGDFNSASLLAAINETTDAVKGLEGGYTTLIGKSTGGDFTTAYTTAETITCSSLPTAHPTLDAQDIEKIDAINTVTGVTTTYMRDDYPTSVAGNVITMTGASFSSDEVFVVYTNVGKIANPNYFEDTVHTDGDPGTFVLSVRKDSPTSTAGTDGDYAAIIQDANGKLYVVDSQLADLETNLAVAHDAVDSGNPIKIGGRARTSAISAVSEDDRTDAIFDEYGQQVNADFDWTTRVSKIMEQAAIPFHRNIVKYSEDYLVATGTGQVYWVIPMDTFKHTTIYIKSIGDNASDSTTIKIYGTVDPDIDLSVTQAKIASDNWDDITSDITGGTASFTHSGVGTNKETIIPDTAFSFEYLVVEFDVTAIGGTDINFTGIAKLIY